MGQELKAAWPKTNLIRGKQPDTFCTAARSPVRSVKYWAIRLWDAGNNEDINMVAGQRARLQCYSRPRSKCKLRIFRKLTRVALLFFGVGYLWLKNLRMSILHRSLNQIWDFCSWRKLLRWSIDDKRRLLGVSITGLVRSRVELWVWTCDCGRLLLCPMQYHEHIYIKPVKTVTIKLVLLSILRNLW